MILGQWQCHPLNLSQIVTLTAGDPQDFSVDRCLLSWVVNRHHSMALSIVPGHTLSLVLNPTGKKTFLPLSLVLKHTALVRPSRPSPCRRCPWF